MLERPENAPEHPYYYVDQLPQEERESFEDRKNPAGMFFFYLIRQDEAGRRESKVQTPQDILYAFRNFKSLQLEKAANRLADKGNNGNEQKVKANARWLSAYENLTLRDVWFAGLWIVDKEFHQPDIALPIDPAQRARLDQLVSVVEDAMRLEQEDEHFPPEEPPPFPDFNF